jgi:hypothetical protein
MSATAKVLRDGADLVVLVGGAPDGFAAFGHPARFGPAGAAVAVRCVGGDLMPLRAAHDWLAERGVELDFGPVNGWMTRRLMA